MLIEQQNNILKTFIDLVFYIKYISRELIQHNKFTKFNIFRIRNIENVYKYFVTRSTTSFHNKFNHSQAAKNSNLTNRRPFPNYIFTELGPCRIFPTRLPEEIEIQHLAAVLSKRHLGAQRRRSVFAMRAAPFSM